MLTKPWICFVKIISFLLVVLLICDVDLKAKKYTKKQIDQLIAEEFKSQSTSGVGRQNKKGNNKFSSLMNEIDRGVREEIRKQQSAIARESKNTKGEYSKLKNDLKKEPKQQVFTKKTEPKLALKANGKNKKDSIKFKPLSEDIDRGAREEINEQTLINFREKRAKKAKKALSVDKQVREEIKRQRFLAQRQAARDRLAGRTYLNEAGVGKRKDFIYKIPTWPFCSIFYAEKDLIEFFLKLEFASKSFNSSGRSRDMSDLVFGKNPFEVQDSLLLSKLLKEGKVLQPDANNGETPGSGTYDTGSQYHYFYVLADQDLKFDASFDKETLSFDYARHFLKGDISFGLQVPIVRRKNKIRITSEISSTDRNDLEAYRPRFFDLYSDLESFFNAILSSKDISFNKSDTEIGFGDVSTFLNVEINSRYFERFIVGGKLLFPTANDKITDKLWYPQLGNGGFVDISLFSSILWGVNDFINPHVHAHLKAGWPSNVKRRVPVKKEYDGSKNGQLVNDYLKMADVSTTYSNQSFSEFDSSVRNVADEAKTVKLRKGFEGFVRLGNEIEHIFSRKAFLDLFYDFRIKGKDYVDKLKLGSDYDSTVITNNTFQTEHRVGLTYLYQFSGKKCFSLTGFYSFWGQNVPKTLELDAIFRMDF